MDDVPGPDRPAATADGNPATAGGEPPTAHVAGPGVYGAPEWLPLRRNLDGEEAKVGCTFDSRGSQFGYECAGHHDRWAIDFIAAPGTPVYAAGAGFATNITGQPGGSGFGNVVRVDHGLGITTIYAHLTQAMVPPEGAWVDQDTQLGTVGSTGSSSTPHLHFERYAVPSAEHATYLDQVSVDPGPLYACRGDLLVSFPQVAGYQSWKGLPWGALTVASDGHACLDGTRPARPAVPVPEPRRGMWGAGVGSALELLGSAPWWDPTSR